MTDHLNDYGKGIYTKVQADLASNDLWCPTYGPMLEAYAYAVQQCRDLREKLDKETVLVTRKNKRGETGENLHPLLLAYQIFLNESLKLSVQFGLTPASRNKIGIGKAKKRFGVEYFRINKDNEELDAL